MNKKVKTEQQEEGDKKDKEEITEDIKGITETTGKHKIEEETIIPMIDQDRIEDNLRESTEMKKISIEDPKDTEKVICSLLFR